MLCDFFDFSEDHVVEQSVRCCDGIFLQEVNEINALLDHLEEHHADHFLNGTPIEVIH